MTTNEVLLNVGLISWSMIETIIEYFAYFTSPNQLNINGINMYSILLAPESTKAEIMLSLYDKTIDNLPYFSCLSFICYLVRKIDSNSVAILSSTNQTQLIPVMYTTMSNSTLNIVVIIVILLITTFLLSAISMILRNRL